MYSTNDSSKSFYTSEIPSRASSASPKTPGVSSPKLTTPPPQFNDDCLALIYEPITERIHKYVVINKKDIEKGTPTLYVDIKRIAKDLFIDEKEIAKCIEEKGLDSLLTIKSPHSLNDTSQVCDGVFLKNKTAFSIGPLIGEGAFGRVYRAIPIYNPTDASLKADQIGPKIIKMSILSNYQHMEEAKRDLQNEYFILAKLHEGGPHIGIQTPPDRPVVILKTGQMAYLAHCYKFGNIDDGLEKIGAGLSADELREQRFDFSSQLMQGLKRAHDLGIRHGDIKPANCLLEEGTCVIADWGGAKQLKNEDGTYNWSTLEWSGSTFGFYSDADMQEHRKLTENFRSLLHSTGIQDEKTYKELLKQALTESPKNTSPKVAVLNTVREMEGLLNKMAKILYAQDVYALGQIHQEKLLGDVGVHHNVAGLITKMCVKNYKERITLDEIFEGSNPPSV